jgi:hypothetical protein
MGWCCDGDVCASHDDMTVCLLCMMDILLGSK